MSISTELAGTRQNLAHFGGDDLLLSGTIVDQDGNPVNLTGCSLKMLVKRDVEHPDAQAEATATITKAAGVGGELTMRIDDDDLAPGNYSYSLLVRFPADYAVAILRERELTAMWGALTVKREVTRSTA